VGNRSALFRRDPALRLALELGFEIRPGRSHWILFHPGTGQQAIACFGRKRSPRSQRNIEASIRRAARPVADAPACSN